MGGYIGNDNSNDNRDNEEKVILWVSDFVKFINPDVQGAIFTLKE